ncbi:hypothetical protein PHLGIDRAFT_96160 [Phlebiopsis gigantea 11061_1 CR5-6]|uniref:ferric-chelate reductase (NADPH) n=1 Tax=Phlebiopsis gigantea (strain 11061_1 CR5-6) TaxID=745531 RepID=A0A0C3S387_PHLG1|nr:hypothetical protein PHLGIDRAFT_96160 [Phlebiopsis gigantea 11061_1 CR5-6]
MKKLDLPVHMPSWTTMLPSLSWVTRISVRPGLSLGGASIMIAYFVTLCYAGVWESNIFSDPLRMGWVAISQLPVVIVLATKNNPVGILIGACYTRLNYLHRFSGRLMVIAVNIHALGYFYSWSLPNTASGTTPPTFNHQLFKPTHLTGFVALIAADVMFVTSLSWMRQRFHGTFKTLHVLGMIVFLIGCYLHAPQATAYLLIAVGIYLFDRLVRLLKTRYTTARVTALSELGMTRVEVLGTNAGWRAGQHVRVRVLERELGGPTGLGMLECHPFTICSVSESPSGENLTLMCKKTGMWTNKLFELARGMEYGSVSSDGSRAEKGSAPRDVRLLIEGPYGGPNHTIYSSFSGALVVAGGSGITYALGVVQDLLQKDRDGRSRLKCIELVWSVQDPSAILPLLHHFSFLLAQSNSKLYYTSLQISVSYTRCFANPPPHVVKVLQHLPAGLRVSPGRPKLQNILNSVVDRACALFHRGLEDDGRRAKPAGRSADSKRAGSRPAGVFVTVCGPQSMAEDLRRVVRSVDPDRRKRAGGVEMFDEVFGG